MYARQQRQRLTQADMTRAPSANLAQERSLMIRYLQETTAGEHSHSLDLDAAMRRRMEEHFGLDFSAVRLVESNLPEKLGADAVAQGDLIRFAPNAFHPETTQGERLLSHELSHIVQQSRAMTPAGAAGMPFYDAAMERRADSMAARAKDGELTAGPVQAFTPAAADQAPMQGNRFFNRLRQIFAAVLGGQERSIASTSEVNQIRNEPTPFSRITNEMRRFYTAQNGNTQNNSYIYQHLGDVTEGQLGYSQDNPTGNDYLEAMDQEIDWARNLSQLEAVFRMYTCDSNQHDEDASEEGVEQFSNSTLSLDAMKALLKQMGRVMLAFPGLRLGKLGMTNDSIIDWILDCIFHTKNIGIANAFFGSGDVNFQHFAFGEGFGMDFVRSVADLGGQLLMNRASSTMRHVGVHELGHVINGHIARSALKKERGGGAEPSDLDVSNKVPSVATELIQSALEELANGENAAASQIKTLRDNQIESLNKQIETLENSGSSDKQRLLNQQISDAKVHEIELLIGWDPSSEVLRKGLKESGLISRYGSKSVTEMFAEALADVCDKGKEASPLNLKIVEKMQQRYLELEKALYLSSHGV